MRHRGHLHSRGAVAAAVALAVALPFNALAAEPTPDPPEPYLIETAAPGFDTVLPRIGAAAPVRAVDLNAQ